MDQIEISEQYRGKYSGPLDAKLTPVSNLAELYASTKRTERYIGMTILVADDGTGGGPSEYWLVGGTANSNWVKKTATGSITISGDDVE